MIDPKWSAEERKKFVTSCILAIQQYGATAMIEIRMNHFDNGKQYYAAELLAGLYNDVPTETNKELAEAKDIIKHYKSLLAEKDQRISHCLELLASIE